MLWLPRPSWLTLQTTSILCCSIFMKIMAKDRALTLMSAQNSMYYARKSPYWKSSLAKRNKIKMTVQIPLVKCLKFHRKRKMKKCTRWWASLYPRQAASQEALSRLKRSATGTKRKTLRHPSTKRATRSRRLSNSVSSRPSCLMRWTLLSLRSF